MRKFFLMVAVAMMTATNVCAQNGYEDTKHEVAVSYGLYSNSQWIDVFENVTTILATATTAKFTNDRFLGPISAEYFYHLKSWLGVGGIFVYGHNKQDIYILDKKDGELTHSYFTLMPSVKFDWLRTKHFGMYSKLAVGVTLRTEKTNDSSAEVKSDSQTMTHVNWQLSALGLEAGSPTIRAFTELGTGEQGIFVAGLRFKF